MVSREGLKTQDELQCLQGTGKGKKGKKENRGAREIAWDEITSTNTIFARRVPIYDEEKPEKEEKEMKGRDRPT